MHHQVVGPYWEEVVIVGVAGAITIACFVAMVLMLHDPGETDPQHPKYSVLRHDR